MLTGATLAIAVFAVLVLPSSADATPPGRNGVIAFSVQRGNDYELMTIRPNGSGLAQLTRNADDDRQPAWSADGKLIALVRNRSSVWTVRADGTRARRLATGRSPAWSPDGRLIAFIRPVGPADLSLAVMNGDGSRIRTLVVSGVNGRPSWSPDGKRIVFVLDSDLWVIGANGGGLLRLTASELDEADPDWAPDGSRIVFVRHHPCGGSCDVPGLVTITPNGTKELEITDYNGLEQPAWSPDGTKIVATGGGRKGLTILRASGRFLREIAQRVDLTGQGIFDPAWQPVRH